MTNNTQNPSSIGGNKITLHCNICGRALKNRYIFYKPGMRQWTQVYCKKCQRLNNDTHTGYQLHTEVKQGSAQNKIVYMCAETVRSEAGTPFRMTCSVCGYGQKNKILLSQKVIDIKNVPCNNPLCPTLGSDYGRRSGNFYTIASGIQNEMAHYWDKQEKNHPDNY